MSEWQKGKERVREQRPQASQDTTFEEMQQAPPFNVSANEKERVRDNENGE